MKQVVILQAMSLNPERTPAQKLANEFAKVVNNLVWRVRVYARWLIITTDAAPNPLQKGGAE